MNKRKGSAIIIAIIVVTFISTVVIGSSQIFLSENTQNSQYLAGTQTWYGAYSALDLLSGSNQNEISLNINFDSFSANSKKLTATATKSSADSAESVTIAGNGEVKYTIKKVGGVKLWLKNIDVSGNDCPQGNELYVYLKSSIDGGSDKILNSLSQIRGVWPDTFTDNSINISSIGKTLTLSPIVNDKFYLGSGIGGNEVTKKCAVTTQWKISASQGALERQGGGTQATAAYSGITKTLNR